MWTSICLYNINIFKFLEGVCLPPGCYQGVMLSRMLLDDISCIGWTFNYYSQVKSTQLGYCQFKVILIPVSIADINILFINIMYRKIHKLVLYKSNTEIWVTDCKQKLVKIFIGTVCTAVGPCEINFTFVTHSFCIFLLFISQLFIS